MSNKMDFLYMSAPIEDISDSAFRTVCFRYGADLTFTEMVRVEGLAKKNACTWSRLNFYDNTPTVIQLLPGKDYSLKKFLSMFKPHESFKGFNFNLGCPSPHIIKIGQGAAMIKRIAKVQRLVDIVKKEKYPISIKMRLGLNKFERDKKVYINLLNAIDAEFFVVHARDASQTYADSADFSVYAECVETGKKIIANGDIKTKEQVDNLKKIGVSGVMIGRAAVHNPGIFNILKGKGSISLELIKKEYEELSEKYNQEFRYRKNVSKHLGRDAEIKETYG
jgi:tRNA-dihydrouridine synthase B